MRALAVVALVLLLSGCAAASDPYDAAWSACVESNEGLYPDGLTDAESGKTYDAEAICHRTVAEQGREHFTELYNDPDWIAKYEDAVRG